MAFLIWAAVSFSLTGLFASANFSTYDLRIALRGLPSSESKQPALIKPIIWDDVAWTFAMKSSNDENGRAAIMSANS